MRKHVKDWDAYTDVVTAGYNTQAHCAAIFVLSKLVLSCDLGLIYVTQEKNTAGLVWCKICKVGISEYRSLTMVRKGHSNTAKLPSWLFDSSGSYFSRVMSIYRKREMMQTQEAQFGCSKCRFDIIVFMSTSRGVIRLRANSKKLSAAKLPKLQSRMKMRTCKNAKSKPCMERLQEVTLYMEKWIEDKMN